MDSTSIIQNAQNSTQQITKVIATGSTSSAITWPVTTISPIHVCDGTQLIVTVYQDRVIVHRKNGTEVKVRR